MDIVKKQHCYYPCMQDFESWGSDTRTTKNSRQSGIHMFDNIEEETIKIFAEEKREHINSEQSKENTGDNTPNMTNMSAELSAFSKKMIKDPYNHCKNALKAESMPDVNNISLLNDE